MKDKTYDKLLDVLIEEALNIVESEPDTDIGGDCKPESSDNFKEKSKRYLCKKYA